jgi:hypothetical protein
MLCRFLTRGHNRKKSLVALVAFLIALAVGASVGPPAFGQSGCVCAECGRSCDSIRTQGHARGCSSYVAPKSAPSGGSGTRYGYSPQAMMMQAIMQPLLNNLFAPPGATSGQSAEQQRQQEQQRIEAEKARQAAENAKKAALQSWAKAQSDEELRKKVEQEQKLQQGQKVLSQMQPVGGAGKLEPFSFGSPKLEMEPVGQAGFPTAHLSEWDRLLCSNYFSTLAGQSTKEVDIRFYGDQAQRAMSGEPTFIECKVPKATTEHIAAKTKAAQKMFEEINVKFQSLQEADLKLSEAKEKVAAATTQKEGAAKQINELEARAAAAPAEEKPEVDDLLAQAQKQLQDAEQELGQSKQMEKEASDKKGRLENELNSMKSKMQADLRP